MLNLYKISNIFIFLLFIIYLFLRPIAKYYEYSYHLLRINITLLSTGVLFFTLALILLRIAKISKMNLNKYSIFPFFLIILVLSLQLASIPYSSQYANEIVLLKYMSMTFVGYLSFYLIGTRLKYIANKKVFLGILWIFMSVVFFEGFLKSETFFIYLDGAMIYLMLADSYAIVSLFLVALLEKKALKYLVFIVSAFILFTLVSRTSFFLFLFVSLVYFFVLNWKTGVLIIFIIFGSIIYNWDTIVTDLGTKNRMIRMVTTGEDSSYNHRKDILYDNRRHVTIERILLGQYMSDVNDFGHGGHYVHSYESFLYSFGILPYLTLYGIIIFIFSVFLFNIKIILQSRFLELTALVGLFLVIEITFSRSYIAPYIWMFVGAFPSIIEEFKKTKRKLKC